MRSLRHFHIPKRRAATLMCASRNVWVEKINSDGSFFSTYFTSSYFIFGKTLRIVLEIAVEICVDQ